MNFTREPIIETIISAKDGYKLVLRNTKGSGGDEYSVDAVEVVSFGKALFYRSQQRPKPFLLPVSDFELQEVRETKIVLKNPTIDKTIKIPAGTSSQKEEKTQDVEKPQEKKKEKRRTRRKKQTESKIEKSEESVKEEEKLSEVVDAQTVSASVLTQLFPPPASLISDNISRYKSEELQEEAILNEGEALQESSLEIEEKRLAHIWTIDSESDKTPSRTNEDFDEPIKENADLDKTQEEKPKAAKSRKKVKSDEDMQKALEDAESKTSNDVQTENPKEVFSEDKE